MFAAVLFLQHEPKEQGQGKGQTGSHLREGTWRVAPLGVP